MQYIFSKIFKVSRDRVRIIEAKAVRKLQVQAERNHNMQDIRKKTAIIGLISGRKRWVLSDAAIAFGGEQ